MGLHLFARFSRVEANWFETRLDFGGARLDARQREAPESRADSNRNPAPERQNRPLPNNAGRNP
jgi:hypothetical protein